MLAVTILAVFLHLFLQNIESGASVSHSVKSVNTDVLGLRSQVFSSPEQRFLINGPVNINKATTEELVAIPRIGPSLAQRIDDFRIYHGPIKYLQELLEVKGVGPRILDIIGPYIKLEHPEFITQE